MTAAHPVNPSVLVTAEVKIHQLLYMKKNQMVLPNNSGQNHNHHVTITTYLFIKTYNTIVTS